jgi:1-acyl-sn-glycerol-3-phosphate acyltransferase
MEAPRRNLAWQLNRAWRVFGTGLSFTVFGLACLLFGFTLFPLACLTTRDRATARRRAQWIVHRWFIFFADFMAVLGVIRYEIHGAEKLRRPGRVIVANHPSLIDVVLLIAHIPEVDCIVKPQIFDNPFMRWPALWAGYIRHDTPEQLIADCVGALKQGHSLLIFPEGTRSVPGQPIHMTHGAARIALEANAEILPVAITCQPLMLNKGVPWYRVPDRAGQYRLEVGEAYPAAGFLAAAGGSVTIAARRLTHHWQEQFSAQTRAGGARPLADPPAHPQYSS